MMIWCELQQLMHAKCHKAGILVLAPTPCSVHSAGVKSN